MGNTDFRVLLKAVLDKSGIKTELKEVQDIINKHSVDIIPELKTTSLRNQMKSVSKDIANDFNKTFGTNLTGNDIFKAYENQAKQVVERNKIVQQSFTDLRKNTYQSIGDKSPELQKMSEMYKQEAVEANKAAEAIAKANAEQNKLVQKSFTDTRKDAYQSIGSKSPELQQMAEMYRKEAIEADKVAVSANKINQAIASGSNEAKIEQLTAKFRTLGLSSEETQKELAGVNGALSSLKNSSDNTSLVSYAKLLSEEYSKVGNRVKILSSEFKGFATESQRLSTTNTIKSWADNNSKSLKIFGTELNQIYAKLNNPNLSLTELKQVETQFQSIKANARDAGLLGKSLGDSFKSAAGSFTSWITVTGTIMYAVNSLRKMKDAVFDVDSAMTNLYKVSDETTSRYSLLLKNANKSAQDLGQSVSNLVEQTANWKKLGFSISEAENLAKISSIYANVGEVDNKTAVSDLVTALKAFNLESSKSITIVDSLNKLGNEFATDAGSLGEGLKNAASALALGGMDINKSLALLTGGSEITQNAGELGNALKIGQMRVMGMKGALEELGEESEGLESISKIQTHILNITKGQVNIMNSADPTKFRDYYDILENVSKVYSKLDQTKQADLLETLFGKQRGNQGAAVIQAFQSGQVQKALEASMNSAGSAYEEQSRWMESLEAKTQQYSASFQLLSQTILNSNFLKSLIESGTTFNNVLTSIIQTIGLFPSAISAIGIGAFVKNFQDLKTAGVAATALREFNTAISSGNASNLTYANILKTVDSQTKINIISQSSLTEKQKLGAMSSAGLGTEEIKTALSTGTLTTAQTTAKVATVGFGAALKGLWATMLANPLLLVGMAITAGIAGWNAYKQSVENMRLKTSEATSTFVESSKSIDDNIDKYKTLHDELTNANTTEERQKQIKEELLNLQKDLNDKYGEEHGKINLVTDAYKDQTQAIRELNKETAQKFLNENTKGLDDAEIQMTSQKGYNIFGQDVSLYSDQGKDILDVAKRLGLETDTDESTGSFTIRLNADPTSAYKQINDFMNKISSLQDKYGKDDSFIKTMLDASSSQLNDAKGIIDEFGDKYESRLKAEIQVNDKLSTGYNSVTNAVEKYNESVAAGDQNNINSARENLKTVKDSIDLTTDEWKRYGIVITEVFNQADTGLYDFQDAVTSNQDGIKTLANTLNGLSKEDLLAMADDGQVDNFDKLVETGKKYGLTAESVVTVLQKLKLIQDDVAQSGIEAFSPLSKSDLISNINSLSSGFESLDKIMNSMQGKNPFDYSLLDNKNFKDAFGNLDDDGESYTNFIEKVSSSPKDLKATQSAFNSLVTTWIDSAGVLDGLSEENSKLATAMLKNMGVTNAEEVVATRLTTAQEHLAAQKAYTAEMSEALSNATADEIPGLITEATQSDITKVALAGLALEKANANNTVLDTSGDIENAIALVNTIGAATTALVAYNKAKSGDIFDSSTQKSNLNDLLSQKTGLGLSTEIDKQLKAYQEKMDNLKSAADKEVKDAIDISKNYKGKGVSTNASYDGGAKTNKAGTDKKKEETTNDIDWIARRTKVIQDSYAKFEELANKDTVAYLGLTQEEFDKAKSIFDNNLGNTVEGLSQLQNYADKAGLSLGELYAMIQSGSPTASKENAFQNMIKMQTETLLPQYQQEVEAYSKAYVNALKAIPSEYKDKIESGGVDIESLPSDLAKKVQAATDANEKLKSSEKQLADGEKVHIETIKKLHDNRISAIDIENEKLEQSNKIIKSQMELMEARGEIVDTDFFKRQKNNNKGLISGNQQNIVEWESGMADLLSAKVSTDSKDYKEMQAKIKTAKNEVYGLKLEQEEYNQKLEQMPIDNLNTLISMYKDISSTIEQWGNTASVTGKKLNTDYFQILISNGATTIDQYQELASEIKNVMDDQEKGSTRWNELYGQLQSVNSEMSSMVQNLKKWNEELLKMPLDNISNYTSELQKVVDGLSGVKSEYDTVISVVTGAINDQVKAINEQKDAVNNEYDASKKALQDKLDLMNKQNKELQLQQKYEQSLYDLQKANQQATEKVIRNGEVVYEQDADKLRAAKEAVQDAKFNMDTDKIQTQIDDLQETLDGLNKKYQDQIDSLQKISDKWSEINGKITQAQNETKANDILGGGWKDKVLSGNDTALFNTFSGMYTNTAEQLKKYQDQIDSTNNIKSLLENYVASYKAGEITYTEAVTGINGLLSQLNQKMSATGNLQNIFDYLGSVNDTAANADAILTGIQSGLKDTATDLLKSLEQYNKNSGMISEYTSSWQQLTDNVKSMLDVLREVRDNLEDSGDSDNNDDENDDDGAPSRKGSSGHVNSGPGASPASNDPIWDLIDDKKNATSRKDGITRGLVGSSSDSDREAKLKLLGLKELGSDELPAILHMGEAVFNQEQQERLLQNLRTSYSYQPKIPDYNMVLTNVKTSSRTEPIVASIQYGDLSFPNVRNVDDAIGEFAKLTDQALRQVVSKYK